MMRRVSAIVLGLLISSVTTAAAQDPVQQLVAICDQAAASPLDKNRPAGAAGVDADKVNPTIAIPACEAAAKAAPDDPRVAFQLGRAYGALKAYESARAQYAKADQLGYFLATNNLAMLYWDGIGVAVDKPRAMELLKKAATAGVVVAMTNLAERYYKDDGWPKDRVAARQWYQRAAEAGDVRIMAVLAWMLRAGDGGPSDLVTARQWLQKAADAGHPVAMNKLGVMLAEGEGGPKDMVAARRWYKASAEGANSTGMENFGVRLLLGQGGPKDVFAARQWLQKSAEAGEAGAMGFLGYCYQNGVGGARDYDEAKRWYKKAMAEGNTDKVVARNLAILEQASSRSTGSSEGSRSARSGANSTYRPPPSVYVDPGGGGLTSRPGPMPYGR